MRTVQKLAISNSCKSWWTPERKKEHSRKLQAYWSNADHRRKQQSLNLRSNNPMHNSKYRKTWKHVMGTLDWRWNSSSDAKDKLVLAWSRDKNRKIAHRKRMKRGGSLQIVMQKNGNQSRKGTTNIGAKKWWASLPVDVRKRRSENLSIKLAENFSGRPNKGFVRGKIGRVCTRFGVIRYDSGWEKSFLATIAKNKSVVAIKRDFRIPYMYGGIRRNFLLDFNVELSDGKHVLVEVKCPYFLHIPKEKAKLRAAKRYAKNNNMNFVLLASAQKAKEGCLCPKS